MKKIFYQLKNKLFKNAFKYYDAKRATYFMNQVKNEPWAKTLRVCQQEIIQADPSSPYAKMYAAEEALYWLKIPQWIYADNCKKPITKYLDIGCAYGTLALFTKKISNCDLYCIDVHSYYLNKMLIDRYGIQFKTCNIEKDQFPWNTKFDAIIFTEVLEHLNFHPLSTLKKLGNLINDSGAIYLSTPDSKFWGRVTKYYSHYEDMPHSEDLEDALFIDDHIYQYSLDFTFRPPPLNFSLNLVDLVILAFLDGEYFYK